MYVIIFLVLLLFAALRFHSWDIQVANVVKLAKREENMSVKVDMLGSADFVYAATVRNLSRKRVREAIVMVRHRRAYEAFLRPHGGRMSNSGCSLVLCRHA